MSHKSLPMLDKNEIFVLELLKEHKGLSSKEVHDKITTGISFAKVKRILSTLVTENLATTKGYLPIPY